MCGVDNFRIGKIILFKYFSINKLDLISDMMNVGLGIDYWVREDDLAVKEVLNSKADLNFNSKLVIWKYN